MILILFTQLLQSNQSPLFSSQLLRTRVATTSGPLQRISTFEVPVEPTCYTNPFPLSVSVNPDCLSASQSNVVSPKASDD